MKITNTKKILNENFLIYDDLLFADIHTVVPQVGSIKGGTLVTIIGTGFQVDITDDIAVDIGGIPCRVSL